MGRPNKKINKLHQNPHGGNGNWVNWRDEDAKHREMLYNALIQWAHQHPNWKPELTKKIAENALVVEIVENVITYKTESKYNGVIYKNFCAESGKQVNGVSTKRLRAKRQQERIDSQEPMPYYFKISDRNTKGQR